MDERSVRMQLAEIKASLARNEEEHAILVSLLRGFEGWLRLHGTQSEFSPQLTLPETPERLRKANAGSRPKGTTSMRGAVLNIVRDARGEPLHVSEILRRAEELGAQTDAKNPSAVIDLICHSLKKRNGLPVEKGDGRTWRWAGAERTNGDGKPGGVEVRVSDPGNPVAEEDAP